MRLPDWVAERLARWRHWPVHSLRRRLLFALLLPMGLVMIGTAPWDFRLAVGPSARAYDDILVTDALALAEQVQLVEGRAALSLSRQAELLLRADGRDEEYFAVRDARGWLLAGDQALPRAEAPGEAPVFSDIEVAFEGGPPKRLRMVTLQRSFDAGPVVVQVAETLNKREAAERRILAAMILPNLLFASISGLLLYAATRVTVAPIEQLAQQVATRSPGDLQPLVLHEPPRELAQVLAALNGLFERVREAGLRQQRFHANVAHQLRTPLTGLRTQIELAQMDGAFAVDPLRHERVVAAIDRMSHLIDQLLSLARAEAGVLDGVGFELVDLPRLIEQGAWLLVDRAVEAGIDLGFDLAAAPPVQGVPVLLGELLNNLVDNALRHCPAGSEVTVACGQRNGRPWLAVEDDGPGIAAEQRERVFARFQRGSATAAEGSGLGLAIVQEIAQLHGASVAVGTPARGRGVRFEVAW
ncbi:MAG: sensor histidine kinase N-terminal domain-containing protein [Burkholderiales bacterium]